MEYPKNNNTQNGYSKEVLEYCAQVNVLCSRPASATASRCVCKAPWRIRHILWAVVPASGPAGHRGSGLIWLYNTSSLSPSPLSVACLVSLALVDIIVQAAHASLLAYRITTPLVWGEVCGGQGWTYGHSARFFFFLFFKCGRITSMDVNARTL